MIFMDPFIQFPHEQAMAMGLFTWNSGIEGARIQIPFGGTGIVLDAFAYIYKHTGNNVVLKNSMITVRCGVPLDATYNASRSNIWVQTPLIHPNQTQIFYTVRYLVDPEVPVRFNEIGRATSDKYDVQYVIYDLSGRLSTVEAEVAVLSERVETLEEHIPPNPHE